MAGILAVLGSTAIAYTVARRRNETGFESRKAIALLARYGPAWRASRLQPMDALRDE